MAKIDKKTRTIYNLELDEEEMKVLANVFYRVQMGTDGPAAVASRIGQEIDKYCYADEFDSEGRPNWIPTCDSVSGAIYWTEPPAWTQDF